MKHSALEFSRLLGLAVIASMITGCGSGGSSDDDVPLPPSGMVRIEGDVTSSGTAVSDATVNFQTTDDSGKNTEYTTITGSNGKFTLDMPLKPVNGVDFPAGTVTKEGYEPQTLLCQGFTEKVVTCKADIRLIRLAENTSIPVGGDMVWHIGDSNYQGQANSKLQKKAPDGAVLEFEISDWAAQVAKNNITKATVVLDHKGWQTKICPNNAIALVGDVGTVSRAGGNSPDTGEWGGAFQEDVPFDFQVSKVGSLRAKVRISAGACIGTDLDDFEINRMRVYFCGDDDSGTCIPGR
jgi:hypothetical protein